MMLTLRYLLRNVNQSAVGREIGKPRIFVWHLATGLPLHEKDFNLIPALAKAINVQEDLLFAVCRNDYRRYQNKTA